MSRKGRNRAAIAAALCAASALISGSLASAATATGDATYKVTITNLTSGQPFSPPYVATSNSRHALF
ncbi:MAG: hypothetical protein LC769_12525, partial [Chloroflexi bacterium]|nr:hypothetical protein [Chloroflexota bacterium]